MAAFPFVSAWAQTVPSSFNYQGRLTDTNNNPINGTRDFVFSLWNGPTTSATALWCEAQTIPVVNGVFATQVGSVVALSSAVFTSSSTYLDVNINNGGTGCGANNAPGGGVSLSPRIYLAAVPYAMTAGNVSPGSSNYIQNTGSLQAGATFYVSSGTVAGTFMVGVGTLTVTQSGNVGIGTTNPTNKFCIGTSCVASLAGLKVLAADFIVTTTPA